MVKVFKKQKATNKPDTKTKKKNRKQKKKRISPDSDSDSSSTSASQIVKLISPYTKPQLIEFIITAAISNPTLYAYVINTADNDVAHRKIFVYGLGWDITKETLTLAFEPFGEIEDCNVVVDRGTGKAKGFGFVQFRYRKGAVKALEEPQRKIGNRMVSCQLACLGSGNGGGGGGGSGENLSRKIYVSNVVGDTDPEKLRVFFSRFGEIEMGPLGFDSVTGKSRGFALFVYRSEEGLRKALEEPYKVFEGNQLHCQKASGGKSKGILGTGTGTGMVSVPVVQQPTPQMLAQNFGLFGQGAMGLNPMYGGLFVNPNGGFIAANPLVAPGVMGQVGGVSGGYYAGAPHGLNIGVHNGSLLGAPPPEVQGLGLLHAYPKKREELGSGSASGSRSQGVGGGSYRGYPSRRWLGNGSKLIQVETRHF